MTVTQMCCVILFVSLEPPRYLLLIVLKHRIKLMSKLVNNLKQKLAKGSAVIGTSIG